MTEKRLRYMRAFLVGSSEFVIDDNATHERLKRYDILDKLNELNDENEQLKHNATVLIQLNQDYRKENEQLKSDNKNLKSNIDDLMNMELEDRDIVCMAGKFRLEEWGKHRLHQFYDGDTPLEDEIVVMRLLDLTAENEQLKFDLDYFKTKNGSLEKGMFNLQRENEQLKQRITELEKEVNSLSNGEADWLIDEML